MSDEQTGDDSQSTTKKQSKLSWLWICIGAALVFKLFGVAGGGIALLAYYASRKNFGIPLSVAISSVCGIISYVALTMILLWAVDGGELSPREQVLAALIGNSMSMREIQSSQRKEVEQATIDNHNQHEKDKQNNDLEKIIQRAITAYPFLDHQSEKANKEAIDAVVALRDEYIKNGDSITDALTKSVNKIGPIYAASKTVDPKFKQQPTTQNKSTPTWAEMQERRARGCNPSGVMTDEEIARCR